MKVIKLHNGMFAKVDDEDYERVVNHGRWMAIISKSGLCWYAFASARHRTPMHQFILQAKGIDHKDLDGLNNQKNNLRIATQSQNLANRYTPPSNTSGYKGVYWNKTNRRWQAQIKAYGKRHYLGSFLDIAQAGAAYDEAAVHYFGEFARVNANSTRPVLSHFISQNEEEETTGPSSKNGTQTPPNPSPPLASEEGSDGFQSTGPS